MNINDLIERLTEIAEEMPDAEVVLATQPSWPLQFNVRGVTTSVDILDPEEIPTEPCPDHGVVECGMCLATLTAQKVYIVEGGGNPDQPYAPSAVFDAAY